MAVSVLFQSHFDGAHGSVALSDFADVSARKCVVALPGGGVSIATDQSVFGGASARFTGADFARLTAFVVDSFGWPFGPSAPQWEIEMRLRWASAPAGQRPFFFTNVMEVYRDSASGAIKVAAAGSTVILTSVTVVPLNTWVSVVVNHIGAGVYRLFIDGALDVTTTSTINVGGGTTGLISIGGGNASGAAFNGWIDEVRILVGSATKFASFTLPGAAYSDPDDVEAAVGTKGVTVLAPRPPVYPVQSATVVAPGRASRAYDAGRFTLSGTTKVDGSPDLPVARRVKLFHERSGRLVQSTFSSMAGAWVFRNLAYERYTVISYDHTGTHAAVIADGQFPSPM